MQQRGGRKSGPSPAVRFPYRLPPPFKEEGGRFSSDPLAASSGTGLAALWGARLGHLTVVPTNKYSKILLDAVYALKWRPSIKLVICIQYKNSQIFS